MRAMMRRWLPFLAWRRPTLSVIGADARAGIAVGLVLIPQAVAYAVLAGMPPITGLYAALLPAVIGVLWGSCNLLGAGPTALTSMLVAGSLAGMAAVASPEWVELAIWLALLAGVMQILLGSLKLGSIVNFLSGPVIGAFTQAAAVLILLSQLGGMLGVNAQQVQAMIAMGGGAGAVWQTLHWGAFAFGVGTLAFLLVLKKHSRRFPLILIAGVVCTLISWLTPFHVSGGAIVGDLPSGLPQLVLPGVPSWQEIRLLLPLAAVIALVSFIEAVSSARVITRDRRERWNENQELIGQGLAKVASGLSGAFPVSASFSRSALYLYAGAVSGWAAVFTALCIVAALLWLTPALAWVPVAFLAAVIVVSVLNLIRPSWFINLWRSSRAEALIAIATFAATLIAAPQLQWGVLTGFLLALVHYLYQRSHPRLVEVSIHPDGTLRDRARFALPRLAPDLLAVRMDASLNFVSAPQLERYLRDAIQREPGLRRVLLDALPINDIDTTGLDMLNTLIAELRDRGVTFYFAAVKKQVEDAFRQDGLLKRVPAEQFFRTEAEAVAHLRAPGEDADGTEAKGLDAALA
ncbi:SulP family inorganic anion transporter [Verticiella sediminum]|uniref:SulP family inorganic anion transporter n=2 Tax=Verticiella sediminum TaxID=1247510 RepID=A0A556B1U9_9BURK|nr:SulP family inorganic anion transporter [Verticiella sediminum]